MIHRSSAGAKRETEGRQGERRETGGSRAVRRAQSAWPVPKVVLGLSDSWSPY